ncbi:MAG: DUF3880 domain-containing protein [Lachnospiraceae bacterium]|nr:DUF3880 domain-containing protein [Lachnospiraceae bacterium]
MKVLFIEWASFGNNDIKEAFASEGHSVVCFPFSNKDARRDAEIEAALSATLHQEVPDVVFSFNYFPVISNVCKKEDVRYISWIYDSPYVMLYSYTVINPCNTIYVFDKELYLEFHNAGIPTVHYMPMAANTDRLDKIMPSVCTPPDKAADYASDKLPYLYNISFIGSLYTEQHNFFDRMTTLSDYTRGYLDALMTAQMKVQGYNFIQESLSPIMEDLYKALPMDPNPDGVETKEYLYAQYVINRKITGLERTDLIHAITEHFAFDLFTPNKDFSMSNLNNHGPVGYYKQMPLVFKQSRINLNISLRSIKSGIPLRAFDIMGSGGFLLSNFQADFLDDFVPGEDFVYYESKEDLLYKIDYYLQHEEERVTIARNGHDKVAAGHTFRHRIREMLA